MAFFLILAAGVSANAGCAALTYCLAEAREEFCVAYEGMMPAALTPEEMAMGRIEREMEAKGCPIPERDRGCPAKAAARSAPPVDCSKIVEEAP